MKVITFPLGELQANCSLVIHSSTGDCVIIDPGGESEKVTNMIKNGLDDSGSLNLKAILLTHAHLDHVAAASDLKSSFAAPVWLHKDDEPLYESLTEQASYLNFPPPPTGSIDFLYSGGDNFKLGDITFSFLHTPGHSPGSSCIFIDFKECEPVLFSGDTLFHRSIGRTDLWGGNHDTLLNSIREKIFTLPEKTVVIPGHGSNTMVGEEKQQNPFFQKY